MHQNTIKTSNKVFYILDLKHSIRKAVKGNKIKTLLKCIAILMSKAVLCFCFLGVKTVGSAGTFSLNKNHRMKRTLLQVCDLIHRFTNRSCLDYNNYGCYCGWGNAGNEIGHVDDADGYGEFLRK